MGMRSLKSLFLTLLVCVAVSASAQRLTFAGSSLPAISESVAASSGLNGVYVLPYVQGISAQFESSDGSTVTWQRFSALGAAYAEPVSSTQSGNTSTLTRLEGNMGYVVTDGDKSYYFWVVDYSTQRFGVRDIVMSSESDCSTTWLDVEGEAPQITCYGINGVPVHLDRGITLTYNTLEFDSETFAYNQVEHTQSLASITNERVYCTPSLCQTDFTITGDKYLAQWGEPQSATSPAYPPMAVAVETRAEQENRDVDNELKEETALGGSGPVDITFRAAVTDGVEFLEWELARDSEFNQVFQRRREREFTITFREQGTTYVRLVAANESGSCEVESETYEVFIGESVLKCPNAFSPGTSQGVNDEWKVIYKSIVEFDCQIFDRNGRRVAHLTDPSQGWDGKIAGKTAPNGVYFYVIRALGTDGKRYKLSGDINTIGFRKGAEYTPID